ncbi:hypothetical protein [Streptomyces kanamyceticus]|uniref:hypothetical protein n=1 Tax=Streptomyces kanamyceticus TaxID=1967 RepID=UPI00295E625A|nr:hypothetical protein [Streptomyces kanamyceticus]
MGRSGRREGAVLPREAGGGGAPFVLGGVRRALRVVAGLACLPYLSLKIAWISGSHLGIPGSSPLLEHRTMMIFANGLTVLMDASVLVLVLLLTRPWGLRTPAWLLAVPMWVASGLLVPIMAGFPLQLLVTALGGGAAGSSGGEADSEPFLHDWVFGVVYSGFILQGIALGALFVLYAKDRWAHLWRGRLGEPARDGARGPRIAAFCAAPLALFPVTAHLLWASGVDAGLNASRAEGRDAGFAVLECLNAVYLLAAVAGALLLVLRRPPSLSVKVPLALAWLGSGAVGCWGGWLLFGALIGAGDIGQRPTGPMLLTYAVHMIIGLLVAATGARFLGERSRSTA